MDNYESLTELTCARCGIVTKEAEQAVKPAACFFIRCVQQGWKMDDVNGQDAICCPECSSQHPYDKMRYRHVPQRVIAAAQSNKERACCSLCAPYSTPGFLINAMQWIPCWKCNKAYTLKGQMYRACS